MIVYKFTKFINESKKEKRKYNNLVKRIGIIDEDGEIDLNDMTQKINLFLSKEKNKFKFLKDFNDDIKSQIKVNKERIKIKDIKPSQNEIFLDKILNKLVINKKYRKKIIKDSFKDNNILISSDNYIIDGHHRWALAFILNPKCILDCTKIEIPIKYALPIINAMLEITEKDNNEDSKNDYNINIFDIKKLNKKKLIEKINNIIIKNIKLKTNNDLINIDNNLNKFYNKIGKKLNLKKHILKHIIKKLKKIEEPDEFFSDRYDMPQLNKKDIEKIL